MDSKPSYLGAFLKHPINRLAMLSAGVAAVFASIPLGWSGLVLVGVVALGCEILAALAIPGLPPFRAWVDREQRHQARTQRKTQLVTEISQQGDSQALATYQHMWSRVQALYQSVQERRTSLSLEDVDKLEDLTLDYLGLCAVNLSLKQRKDHASEDVVVKRIASLKTQLERPNLPEEEARQLRTALAEYQETLQRSRRLAVRRSALEATLISLPDKMEEVYQLVITSPYSSEMGSKLEESLARLRIAEEVAAEFDAPDSFDLDASRNAAAASKTPIQPPRKPVGTVKA
ncbi:MAG: hypothetical protein ACOYNF_01795 [Rhodoferax sp.]